MLESHPRSGFDDPVVQTELQRLRAENERLREALTIVMDALNVHAGESSEQVAT